MKNLKSKLVLSSFVNPIFATNDISGGVNNSTSINLNPTSTNFTSLQNLTIPQMISGAINLVLILVTVVFFFILVIGGLKWITSGGDEKKVAAARAQITNALIGLAIVFAAWAIMALIKAVFGINVDITGTGLSLPSFNQN